jgi:hypothetical protein
MDLEKVAARAKSMLKAETKPEPKDAGADSSSETKKIKDEAVKAEPAKADVKAEDKAKDIEAQDKKDEEVLSKKDEELNDDQKKRKVELVKIKQGADEKEKKSNVQKRFDELTAKIKELESDRNSTKAERDTLRTELDGIKKQLSMTPQDKVKEKIKSEISARQKKYLDEDKNLPREERREMTKDELDAWALEDYEGANEWVSKRTYRRIEEEKALHIDLEQTAKAEAILEKQQKSAEKTYIKHPELDVSKRQNELKSQGKSNEEIIKTLCAENPKYKLAVEIYHENPTKYMLSENGPELIVEEIEKRLPKTKEPDNEVIALKTKLAEIEAENKRLKGLDTGLSSHAQGTTQEPETEIGKKQAEVARKLGIDPNRIKRRVVERAELGYDR